LQILFNTYVFKISTISFQNGLLNRTKYKMEGQTKLLTILKWKRKMSFQTEIAIAYVLNHIEFFLQSWKNQIKKQILYVIFLGRCLDWSKRRLFITFTLPIWIEWIKYFEVNNIYSMNVFLYSLHLNFLSLFSIAQTWLMVAKLFLPSTKLRFLIKNLYLQKAKIFFHFQKPFKKITQKIEIKGVYLNFQLSFTGLWIGLVGIKKSTQNPPFKDLWTTKSFYKETNRFVHLPSYPTPTPPPF